MTKEVIREIAATEAQMDTELNDNERIKRAIDIALALIEQSKEAHSE